MTFKATAAVLDSIEKEQDGALDTIFDQRITDHCLPIFNINGAIRKWQKSKLVEILKFVEMKPADYTAIIDIGFIWRLAIPNNDEEGGAVIHMVIAFSSCGISLLIFSPLLIVVLNVAIYSAVNLVRRKKSNLFIYGPDYSCAQYNTDGMNHIFPRICLP